MSRIFVGLAVINVLFFISMAMLGIGLLQDRASYYTAYFTAGLFTTLYTVFLQSLIFIYFLGTGKWVKDTVAGKPGEAKIVEEAKRLKGMTFGVATYSAFAMVTAAILAAAVDVGFLPGWVHPLSMVLAIGLNLFSYFPEAKAIGQNVTLLDEAEAVGEGQAGISGKKISGPRTRS